jgi:hypothetical protein
MGMNVFSSATESGAVTPSDSTRLRFHALYVGGTGNVVIKHNENSPSVTYSDVPAGMVLYVSGVRVMAATTATNIVWMRW